MGTGSQVGCAHATAEDAVVLTLTPDSPSVELEQAVADVQDLDHVVELDQLTDGMAQLARIAHRSLAERNRVVRLRLSVAHLGGVLLRRLASQPRPGRAKRPRGDTEQFRPKLPSNTLQRYGISAATSSSWQAVASLPFSDIEQRCVSVDDAQRWPTTVDEQTVQVRSDTPLAGGESRLLSIEVAGVSLAETPQVTIEVATTSPMVPDQPVEPALRVEPVTPLSVSQPPVQLPTQPGRSN